MDIQRLVDIDKHVMLALNGSDSLYMDGVMKIYTTTAVWIPVAVVLLFIVLKNNTLRNSLLIILSVALTILLTDKISSDIIKPLLGRLRPSHDPEFMHLIDTFNGYRSGSFSFTSSHACNSFGIFMFISLLIKNRTLSLSLLAWAAINSYSRIYLGVHFPGDILCGDSPRTCNVSALCVHTQQDRTTTNPYHGQLHTIGVPCGGCQYHDLSDISYIRVYHHICTDIY